MHIYMHTKVALLNAYKDYAFICIKESTIICIPKIANLNAYKDFNLYGYKMHIYK